LGDLRRRQRTAFSLTRITLGETDDAPFTSAPRGQDHSVGNLIEDPLGPPLGKTLLRNSALKKYIIILVRNDHETRPGEFAALF
jgi:hypothetical protein